jgi:hypothetical protein
MDREILVANTLTHEMIEIGRQLIEEMERAPMDGAVIRAIDAAFWMKEVEDDFSRWSLVIAIPGLSLEGPRKGYQWVSQALDSMSKSPNAAAMPNNTVVVVDTIAGLMDALWASYGMHGIRNQYHYQAVVGDKFFEELYIYRVDPRRLIECVLHDSKGINRKIRGHHVYVFGERLTPEMPLMIVAHGWLRLKVNDSWKAVLELPEKYGIESGNDVTCRSFAWGEHSKANGVKRNVVHNVLVSRISN